MTSRKRRPVLVALALTALLAGRCESDNAGTPDATTQRDAASGQDGTTQPDGAGQADGAVGDSGVDPDATPPDSGVTPDAGSGGLVVSYADSDMWANCMPMVAPDPWGGTVDLLYNNTAGSAPATATVLGARMIFQVTGNPTLNITLTPTAAGPVAAGDSVTLTHTKSGSLNDLTGDCGFCGATVVYEVTLDVGGQQRLVTSPAVAVQCAM